jgi:hypothetical protein
MTAVARLGKSITTTEHLDSYRQPKIGLAKAFFLEEPPMPSPTNRPERLGHAELIPGGEFRVREFISLAMTYTAGPFGIDDTGGIKVAFRFATDGGNLQVDDPTAMNFVTAEASNGATLKCWYDPVGHFRPWDRAFFVRVLDGCLVEGDRITIRFGDRSQGSPGLRLQTFCEWRHEFRVLVDAIATGHYEKLPECPYIAITPGPPRTWKAVLPSQRRSGDTFRLGLKAEDRWGNPSDKATTDLFLEPSLPVAGLPERVRFESGRFALTLDDLRAAGPGMLRVRVRDATGSVLVESNPMRVLGGPGPRAFWGDLHGQSGETVGTNTARDYFAFARDHAFLDVTSHQGNDFEITQEFWAHLNDLTAEFDQPGRFVAFPGYEWSGNTGVGGDRNVFFRHEGRTIRRSSHALVEDQSDIETDCNTAEDLFRDLQDEDVVTYAHVGGRYANLAAGHDSRIETAMEIHSAWGTFQWLLHDAFDLGHRVGVVCNSDGHKGRPGASYPGASVFGAYGGLTCFLTEELSRDTILECLRQRHHYGTTGARTILDAGVADAMMGDVVRVEPGTEAVLATTVIGTAPIERIDFFNGKECIATRRPYTAGDLGRRIRVIFEGAAYRGRGRQVRWDGSLRLDVDKIREFRSINWWNPERPAEQTDSGTISWSVMTTGNFVGFDIWLEDGHAGDLIIDTPLVKETVSLASIGFEDTVLDAGGLGRRVRLFRLPEENPHGEMHAEFPVAVEAGRDNPLFVRVTQEDGHVAWSSPVYVFTQENP